MVGQNPQCLLLLQAQLARDFVNHTQRPQGIAVRRDERCPGVETDLRFGSYEGVIRKPLVQGCVRNNEQAGLRDGVGAKRDVPRGLGDISAELGFEPLALLVHQ